MITARGAGHTLKCAREMPDAGPNEVQQFRVEVSGFFRTIHREWPETFTVKTQIVKQF